MTRRTMVTRRTMKSLVKRFEALGITFQTLSPSPFTEGWTQIEKRGPSFAWGPAGGACDIATREVWMEDLKPHEVLHEAMHVLLAVPKIPIKNQPDEGLFLMPIERAYAQVLLSCSTRRPSSTASTGKNRRWSSGERTRWN